MTAHDNHDDALRTLLRASAPQPPVDDVDWDALHARIQRRAAPLLKRAPQAAWWQLLAGWSRHGVPAAAAAAAVVALLIGTGTIAPRHTSTTRVANVAYAPTLNATASFVTVEEELTYTASEAERAVLIAGIDENEMLDAVLFYQEGR